MYASVQGRFTSIDPLLASGKASHPQSWNRYSYVGNYPTVLIDPLGLEWYQNTSTSAVEWYEKDKQPTGYVLFTRSVYNISDTQSVILNPEGPNKKANYGTDSYKGWTYGPAIDESNPELRNYNPFDYPEKATHAQWELTRAAAEAFGNAEYQLELGPFSGSVTASSSAQEYLSFGLDASVPPITAARNISFGEPKAGLYIQGNYCIGPCQTITLDIFRFSVSANPGIGTPTVGIGANIMFPAMKQGPATRYENRPDVVGKFGGLRFY
jgi:hypothetical protein